MKVTIKRRGCGLSVRVNGRRAHRIPRNRSGVRQTFLTSKYVIKLELVNDGYDQCRNEARRWRRAVGTPDAKFLVPILASGRDGDYLWVVQPRIHGWRRVTRAEIARDSGPRKANACKCSSCVADLLPKPLEKLAKRLRLSDLHRGNYFVCNGQYLIHDYGV